MARKKGTVSKRKGKGGEDMSAIVIPDEAMAKITRRRTDKFWTKRQEAFLRKWWEAGYCPADIAENMPGCKRSAAAVRGKANGMGLNA